jgi:hypothetical protein
MQESYFFISWCTRNAIALTLPVSLIGLLDFLAPFLCVFYKFVIHLFFFSQRHQHFCFQCDRMLVNLIHFLHFRENRKNGPEMMLLLWKDHISSPVWRTSHLSLTHHRPTTCTRLTCHKMYWYHLIHWCTFLHIVIFTIMSGQISVIGHVFFYFPCQWM